MSSMDYKCRRWILLRGRVLKRDKYCRECARYTPLPKHSTIAHHCWPADEYPEYRWSSWNLIGLCAACHDKMHDRVTNRLTENGERWKKKISPPSENL